MKRSGGKGTVRGVPRRFATPGRDGMTRPTPPWWMLVLAAAFVAYYAVFVYCDVFRPEDPGLTAEFTRDAMVVDRVADGSPAEAAGLRIGDRIVTAGGVVVTNRRDWMIVDANVELGRPVPLAVERAGRRIPTALTLGPAPLSFWLTAPGLTLAAVRAAQALTLALGLVVAFRRPDDPAAGAAAWLLATAGGFSVVWPYRVASVWRSVPEPLGAALWIPHVSTLAAGAILCTFFALFPRRLIRSAWGWVLLWIPIAVVLVGPMADALRTVYWPDQPSSVPYRGRVYLAVSAGYVVAGLAALGLNYRHLESLTERRRWHVVGAGSAIGLTSGMVVFALYWFRSSGEMGLFSSPALALGTVLFLAFPLSLVHAILRHRFFDIRVIIRQGLQYALARRLLLSVVPALGGLLVLDLLVHRDQPLAAMLETRGWIYLSLVGMAAVAHARRQQWLDRLDRRFFRERYDANRLLRQVAEELRQTADLTVAAPRLVTEIAEALHPTFVAVLVREPDWSEYRCLALSPAGATLRTLPGGLTITRLVHVLGRPVELSLTESGWLRRQLPPDEAEWLGGSGIDLLLPVATGAQGSDTLLALGAKRSEEPYAREDLDLLAAVASSLGLLIDRAPVRREEARPGLEECPGCGACYDAGTTTCPQDHAALERVPLERTLAGRYRVERRLGRGGMATVYAAKDTALDRRVAVKVMREDVGGPAVADRFWREAKIVAGFVHPNVVTVHDFGVEAGRAFLIMELLHGTTLRDALREGGRMAPSRVIALLGGVSAAVDAAHRRSLIHRDLKPENVFIVRSDGAETAKILDFGIAKVLETRADAAGETTRGVLLGTPSYMAPEQLRGGEPSPAWDLWALAVIAHEMLVGAHPFAGVVRPGSAAPASAGDELEMDGALTQAPGGWRPFFARALAVDPANRPDSARTFLAELRQAVSSETRHQ